MSGVSNGGDVPSTPISPPPPGFWVWVMRQQFELNCLASVAIEYPALRPLVKERQT